LFQNFKIFAEVRRIKAKNSCTRLNKIWSVAVQCTVFWNYKSICTCELRVEYWYWTRRNSIPIVHSIKIWL
jgi:hypothetical protein